ncbi:FAD:protein FMN transferase [Neisseria chenwenguii]|uniref:FAD:protein FMN transferase n=1 Tax=Neisseria chenwenguii TaxID=1853278 RepID=UPI000F4DDAB0|nr:FAD:protein FMN transferase [Neisseria chenwenguii]ROV56255.1 FAD:protein FMN transferase [Neisseria chenwenguii]
MNPLTRRRFLAVSALTATGIAVPFALTRKKDAPVPSEKTAAAGEPFIWRGIALGSGAELRIYHPDRRFTETLAQKALIEVLRLEKIFSLYRDDSAISRLNREGRLNSPPADLLAVLSLSRKIHRATKGAFDPSIQPLWNLYADYFRRHPKAETLPSEADMKKALRLVGFDKVRFDDAAVSFAEKGMSLSLNGIAQGYITDKIVELLRKNGIRRALADMGEIRGLDDGKVGTWRVGIKNPQDESQVLLTVPLQNQAFATSGGYGTTMDEAGKFTHLFDPRTGLATPRYRSISVMAATAAVADAFSTAFSVMPKTDIRTAAEGEDAKVWLVDGENKVETVG